MANEPPLSPRQKKESAFQFFRLLSIMPCRAIGLYRRRFRIYVRIYRDARTRSEPVPAWCRCNDGTHFFLCIGYFRFHDTSDRFDTKRAQNVRAGCVRRAGRARISQNSRKFCSTAANEIPREITSAVLR